MNVQGFLDARATEQHKPLPSCYADCAGYSKK